MPPPTSNRAEALVADTLISLAVTLERERCGAFVAGDIDRIKRLLDAELRYTHSNGVVDTKESLVALLDSGSIRYANITPDVQHVVAIGPDGFVISGILETHVIVAGAEKLLKGRYTAAWRCGADGSWRLVALQGSNVGAPGPQRT